MVNGRNFIAGTGIIMGTGKNIYCYLLLRWMGKKCVVIMKLPFGFFASVTKMLGFCEISSCLENYTFCTKYLYQTNTLRTFRSLGNFVSFNDYNDGEKLPNNATSENFALHHTCFFKAVTYHSVTLFPQLCLFYIRPPPCTAHFCFSNYFLFSSQILSPWLGDIADSVIGLSYRSASLCSLVVNRYDNHMPELTLSPPSQGPWIWLQLTRPPP